MKKLSNLDLSAINGGQSVVGGCTPNTLPILKTNSCASSISSTLGLDATSSYLLCIFF